MTLDGVDYEVIRLLGKGKGGYSYLVTDGDQQYVLKQIHHEPCDYYQFGDKLASELRDYARLSQIGIPMPKLLAVDEMQERLLKEYIDGPTIAELVAGGAMKPDYIDQVRAMCDKLYANGLNIDYYPPISWCRKRACTISTMSATNICSNGILKTWACSIGNNRNLAVAIFPRMAYNGEK